MENFFDKKTKLIFLFIFLAELFSIFAFLLPNFGTAAFFAITALVLVLSVIKVEYGILILLAELFIGSKGYLFYFESGGTAISIRIALWLIVLAVWLGKFLVNWARNKQRPELELGEKNIYFHYFPPKAGQPLADIISRQRRVSLWLILFLFIAWGVVNGFLNHNDFGNIFFDFNGWLYFALIFPIYGFAEKKENIRDLGRVFLAAMSWLAVKTFFLLFAFSHDSSGLILELYRWVRTTGVGEITAIQGGFYRIFFQSHIFILLGFFILLAFFPRWPPKNKKLFIIHYSLFILSLSVILVSFSRSFWVGLSAGLLFYYLVIIFEEKTKTILKISVVLLATGAAAVVVIFAIVKFPYPSPLGGFDTSSLFSERLSKTDEAAISSRWQLLPPLWAAIKKAPILGTGFGTTVTYQSKDPRILETNVDGQYTTYAFEWGWLDIWLKLGFLGLISYIVLMAKIAYDGLRAKNRLGFGLAIGLVVLAAVSFFSPYANHPLGIGYLIIAAATAERLKTDTNLA
ncbi:MAG: O-antigen ligase family protein [Patescibacteria group bacterium]|nr:O-antigen ligase family protein [Patescibacteria group bacterium]